MGCDPAALTRTPVSPYRRGLCGAFTAQHRLFSTGEDKRGRGYQLFTCRTTSTQHCSKTFFVFLTLIIVLGD